jgi:hypothetical protein
VAFTTNVRQITLLVDGQALFQVRTDTSSGDATPIKVPPKKNPNQLAKLQKDGLGFMTIGACLPSPTTSPTMASVDF